MWGKSAQELVCFKGGSCFKLESGCQMVSGYGGNHAKCSLVSSISLPLVKKDSLRVRKLL